MAASDKIKERGGLKTIYSESVIYNHQDIVYYLTELGSALERATQSESASKEAIGIVVHNMNHAIGLTYKPGFGWKFNKAIKYMLKNWEKLTRFLQIPGVGIPAHRQQRHGARVKNPHQRA